jgi:hypothetical protein
VSDLERLNIIGSPPGGIDQSDRPGKNTVFDAVNIDTYTGKWTSRDTLKNIYQTTIGATCGAVRSACDYISDPKYPDSIYSCVLYYDPNYGIMEFNGTSYRQVYYDSTNFGSDGGVPGVVPHFAKGLLRYTKNGATAYTPAIVISGLPNGRLFVYTQRADPTGAIGVVEELVGLTAAADILSDKTHLGSPPFGKYVVNFQDRIVVLNMANGANRIAFTGADIARAIPVNCWPASYNLDVGGPEAITGAAVYGDRLFIFKRDSIYMLSGSGDGGAWDIELYSDDQGAIDQLSITATPSGIYFASGTGFWRISGSNVEDLSRGRVDKIIMAIQAGLSGTAAPIVFCDQKTSRVFFMINCSGKKAYNVSTFTAFLYDLAVVYDYRHDAWTRWGVFDPSGETPYSVTNMLPPGITCAFGGTYAQIGPTFAFRSTLLNPNGDVLFFYSAAVLSGAADLLSVYTLVDGYSDWFASVCATTASGGFTQAVAWMLKTNPIPADRDMLVRKLLVRAVKTGNWYLGAILGRGNQDLAQAIRNKSIPWVIITDRSTATEKHCLGPGAVMTQFSGGLEGPVTVYSIKNCAPIIENLAIVPASGAGHIKFASFKTNYFDPSDILLVVPSSTTNYRTSPMTPNRGSMYL